MNLYWLKRDLRLEDNEALLASVEEGTPTLIIYIYEPSLESDKHYSERHWRFVFESIEDLDRELKQYGAKVLVLKMEAVTALETLAKSLDVKNIFSSQETGIKLTYDRDIAVASFCEENGIKWYEIQNGGVVRGLKDRSTWTDNWYGFMSKAIKPIILDKAILTGIDELDEEVSSLHYQHHYIESEVFQHGGRSHGKDWEDSFFNERLEYYSDYISKPENSRLGCSRLSPYLAWGCLSVREVYQRSMRLKTTSPHKKSLFAFRSRLRWQAHFIQKFEMEPRIESEAFNEAFITLEQPINQEYVEAWKTGNTGFPLVDASIRAVVETGYLNFRMRTMSTSFLLHHLFQHFSTGSAWLARQFLDFEPGIHYSQFQMQAGFTATNTVRVYNPTKNALDHDPEAVFIKKWIPELSSLPAKFAIEPWLMSDAEQKEHNFMRGVDYPERIIDMKETRAHALKVLYGHRKSELAQTEKQRILDVHTIKRKAR